MNDDAIYQPVVTRLPEALQQEAEAIAEVQKAQEQAEQEAEAKASEEAQAKAEAEAQGEQKSYDEDIERLHRESE